METYTTLLAVSMHQGRLSTAWSMPPSLGDCDAEAVAAMIPRINAAITLGEAPGRLFAECLQQIERYRFELRQAYVTFFATYQRCFGLPHDSEMPRTLLEAMPDTMLREYGDIWLHNKAYDYVLPRERETLIDQIVSVWTLNQGAVHTTGR